MKKVERINVIMRYINNRAHFTLSEIMREFNISRSTAIRDIREIEALGMPLVAEAGRDGGYSVMRNSVLPVVRFTDNEVKALFIAFMATRNQQLPYLKSRQSLAEKLLGLLSENQQEDLFQLNQLLFFEGTNPNNPDLLDLSDLPHPMLEKLIRLLLTENYLCLTVEQDNITTIYPVYLLHLYREKNLWLIEGYDLLANKRRIVPVDQISDVKPYQAKKKPSKKKILETLKRQSQETNLVLELGPKAIGQFRKYHPFKLYLAYTNPYQTTAVLRTYVDDHNPDEISEILNWILFLGPDVAVIEMPIEVQNGLKGRLDFFNKNE